MPCDYKRYPKNWKTEIRPAILSRAGNMCERCKAPNHAYIIRGIYDGKDAWQDENGTIFSAENGEVLGDDYLGEICAHLPVNKGGCRIVLTIAHIDNPDPMDCRPENLQALCQRCHNLHDAPMRKANAAKTRAAKKGIQDLF